VAHLHSLMLTLEAESAVAAISRYRNMSQPVAENETSA
jgi:GTP pyrophosphokinase/guanosine-3',5'-bis(diphosphate) 3'-pyrophosphohydrolase